MVAALREHGVDVATTNEAGLSGVDDQAQLSHATEQHRVIVTNNISDFVPLHAQWLREGRPAHAGIVIFGQQTFSIGETVRRLVNLSRSCSPEEMENRLDQFQAVLAQEWSQGALPSEADRLARRVV